MIREQIEINIPPDFQATLDDNEKLLWADKPHFIPYMLSAIWHHLIILACAAFFILGLLKAQHDSHQSIPIMFLIMPVVLLLIGVGGILNALLNYAKTIYAYSVRRVIIRSGIVGVDYRTIDYDKIADTAVTVNLFEKIFSVGTVRFSNGAKTSKGVLIYDGFTSIRNPYEVFKQLKEVTVNVKTDYDYPNALRPESNPGYKTGYNPE